MNNRTGHSTIRGVARGIVESEIETCKNMTFQSYMSHGAHIVYPACGSSSRVEVSDLYTVALLTGGPQAQLKGAVVEAAPKGRECPARKQRKSRALDCSSPAGNSGSVARKTS